MKIYNPERFNSLPDVILFDADNTLYPYEPAHHAAMDAVTKKVLTTFHISESDFNIFFQEARKQIKEQLKDTAASHSRLLYFQRMLEIMGLGSRVLWALDFEQTYWRTYLANSILFDGVKEVLDDLRRSSITLGIITDLTAQIQFRKLIYLGIDQHFDYVITSEEAGIDKPHAAPYALAAAKMQLKEKRVWMIGDHPRKDIGGAKQHIQAVTIQKYHNGITIGENEEKPDAAFNDYHALRSLLGNLSKE